MFDSVLNMSPYNTYFNWIFIHQTLCKHLLTYLDFITLTRTFDIIKGNGKPLRKRAQGNFYQVLYFMINQKTTKQLYGCVTMLALDELFIKKKRRIFDSIHDDIIYPQFMYTTRLLLIAFKIKLRIIIHISIHIYFTVSI